MKVPGFSMLEFLIYNTLFCFLAFLGTVLITRTCMNLKIHEVKEQALLDTSLAYDFFARDVYHAPPDKKEWKHVSDTAIIWHDSHTQQDKGWCWKEKCLYTIQGKYDKETQQWFSSHKNLVAPHLEHLQFLLHEDNNSIRAVSIVVADDQWYVGIRARNAL